MRDMVKRFFSELRWVSERKVGRRRSEACGKDFLVKKYFCRKILLTRGEKVWETFARAEDDGPSRARIKIQQNFICEWPEDFSPENTCGEDENPRINLMDPRIRKDDKMRFCSMLRIVCSIY